MDPIHPHHSSEPDVTAGEPARPGRAPVPRATRPDPRPDQAVEKPLGDLGLGELRDKLLSKTNHSPVDRPPPMGETGMSNLMFSFRLRESTLPRRVTIADVAKLCGVTPATVSRVLNGKKKFSASAAVRQKITDTARKLGYVPDLSARNLNRQSTSIIGVFASPGTHAADGINDSLFDGLTSTLHPAGFDVFFGLASSNGRAQALPSWRFDGAILLQAPKAETVRELDHRGVPYVCVNENVGNPVASVLADDVMGMRRAVDHLAQLGHKRIAYANARATYFSHYSVTERYETLFAQVKHHGITLAGGHHTPFTSATDFLRLAVNTDGCTAIITYDHQIAVALVGAAHVMGLRIPNDFSLICFNDVFPVAVLGPSLTAVAVSGREMGRVGADLLLNSLLSMDKSERVEVRIPEDLIVRASTAPPPAVSKSPRGG